MATFVPVSTHVVESAVIKATKDVVWAKIKELDFSWWNIVSGTSLKHGASPATVGAVITLSFKDGVSWDIQIEEMSNINKTVTFEVIQSEPASSVTSVIHSISLRRITADNSTYIEWVTDFSNDATAETISDSRFKRLEAFTSLAASLA